MDAPLHTCISEIIIPIIICTPTSADAQHTDPSIAVEMEVKKLKFCDNGHGIVSLRDDPSIGVNMKFGPVQTSKNFCPRLVITVQHSGSCGDNSPISRIFVALSYTGSTENAPDVDRIARPSVLLSVSKNVTISSISSLQMDICRCKFEKILYYKKSVFFL